MLKLLMKPVFILLLYLQKTLLKLLSSILNNWKNGEKTKQYKDTDIVYTYDGKVYYINDKGKEIKLRYLGYDKSSYSLKYGFSPQYNDNRVLRI